MAAAISTNPPIFYEAKWPEKLNPALKSLAHKVMRVIWDIISVIIFPIGLMRLAIKWLKNKVLRVIVPGNIDLDMHLVHFKSTWDWIKAIGRFLVNSEHFKIDRDVDGKKLLNDFGGYPLKLTTPDKVKLCGAFFPNKIRNKAIIYATGRTGQWENKTVRLNELLTLNTSLLMVNPRGVGRNKDHRSEEGYALDIYAAYDFLINHQNIDPNDIVLVGFSMGGAYGTCGAALAQQQYPDKEFKAISINSFSDLQLEVQTSLQGHGILKLIGRIAAKVLRLKLNPKAAWDKLKGEKWIFYNPSDELIPKSASLYRAVKKHPVGTTHVVKLHNNNTGAEHTRHFKPDELSVLQATILRMLKLDCPPVQASTLKIKTIAPS